MELTEKELEVYFKRYYDWIVFDSYIQGVNDGVERMVRAILSTTHTISEINTLINKWTEEMKNGESRINR